MQYLSKSHHQTYQTFTTQRRRRVRDERQTVPRLPLLNAGRESGRPRVLARVEALPDQGAQQNVRQAVSGVARGERGHLPARLPAGQSRRAGLGEGRLLQEVPVLAWLRQEPATARLKGSA